MKPVIAIATAVLLAVPALASAQSSPVTRAQVIQELKDLESFGYDPARGELPYYPNDILAAQERLAAKRLAGQQ